jgi:hypothetical protein
LPSIWWQGHLDFQWLLLQRAGSWLGVGLSPLKHSLQKCPSCPASSGYRLQLGGALSESNNETMVSLIFSLLLLRSWTYRHSYKYRHGYLYYLVHWLFPSATDWVFYEHLGLTVRNLSLRRTSHLWLWVHCGMLSDSVLNMLQEGKRIFFRLLL